MTVNEITLNAGDNKSPVPQSTPKESDVMANPLLALSEGDIWHNLRCCLMINIFWSMGAADTAIALTPLLVFLNASNKLIGIVGGVAALSLVGSILSPWITRRFPYKKKYAFAINSIYLVPIGLVGFVLVLSQVLHLAGPAGSANRALLWIVAGSMLIYQFLAGFVTLPTQEFLAACIPMNFRGRLMGYSASFGSLTSLASSALGWWILGHYEKPMSFGYLFILMWLLCQGGFLFALFARETPTPVEKSPPPWSPQMFRDFWYDRAFMRVTLLNGLGSATIFSIFGFVTVYGFKELKMPAETAAIIQIVGQLVRVAFGSFVGLATDRYKPCRVMPWWLLFAGSALLPPILLHNTCGVYISVGLSGLFTVAWGAGMGAFNTGLPRPEHRAGHMSFAVLTTYLMGAIGSFSMGWLCDAYPFHKVFTGIFIWLIVYFFIARRVLATVGQDSRMSMNAGTSS